MQAVMIQLQYNNVARFKLGLEVDWTDELWLGYTLRLPLPVLKYLLGYYQRLSCSTAIDLVISHLLHDEGFGQEPGKVQSSESPSFHKFWGVRCMLVRSLAWRRSGIGRTIPGPTCSTWLWVVVVKSISCLLLPNEKGLFFSCYICALPAGSQLKV